MIHWGHVHSSDRRVPTNSGPAVDLQWDFTITFVQRTPNCCTNNRRPPLNLAAVDVLLGVVWHKYFGSDRKNINILKIVTNTSTDKRKQPIEVEYNLPHMYNPNKRRFKPQILNKRRKKIKLNSLRIRKLPLAKVSSLLHSSRHKDQSS
ncbi:hypothetical protein BD560DRAFT_424166 [Blakeslea trispora]|nr:hypothetical protein BD560DRAFT_424166 [Blakeslea trispora]